MKIAIFEQIITSGGHEIEFDRIIVEELLALGHEVFFYVPRGHIFKFDYKVKIVEISGAGVNYAGAKGLSKFWLAAKREIRRIMWFNELFVRGKADEYDLLIMPTTTQRYLRALKFSKLKNSIKPFEFIVHGLRPEETIKMTKRLRCIPENCPLKIIVLTLIKDIFAKNDKRIACVNPPAYAPRDIVAKKLCNDGTGSVELGFFGQYRREKKLDDFLDAFLDCKFDNKVKLVVQGATNRQEDKDDFERTIAKYRGRGNIEFINISLIGIDWQKALVGTDVIMIPYAAPRYRYHWSAMLFSAIGYFRPVVSVGDVINPEVFEHYKIGESFSGNDMKGCKQALQRLVANMKNRKDYYNDEIERAYKAYSPTNFAEQLVALASEEIIR